MSLDLYERLFAIYVKTKSVNLALAFLIHLEESREGQITFVGERVIMATFTFLFRMTGRSNSYHHLHILNRYNRMD